MASTTSNSKDGAKGRKKITRTACEPCREKRAKCDGQSPCERCTNRKLECHFTQRAWSSKRSLQDDIVSLKARVTKREDLLEALLVPGTGDSLLGMLRTGEVSMDEAADKIASARREIKIENRNDEQFGYQNMEESEMGWSPGPGSGTIRSPDAQTALSDDSLSQGFPASTDGGASGIMRPPWATPDFDQQSFGNMLDGDAMATNSMDDMMPGDNPMFPPEPQAQLVDPAAVAATMVNGQMPMFNGNQPPIVIDPLLWPPPNDSDPLGRPWANTWTGLQQNPQPGEVSVPV